MLNFYGLSSWQVLDSHGKHHTHDENQSKANYKNKHANITQISKQS